MPKRLQRDWHPSSTGQSLQGQGPSAATAGSGTALTPLRPPLKPQRWTLRLKQNQRNGVAGFLIGERTATRPVPTFRGLNFRRGALVAARFAPDPRSAVYSAAWEGNPEAVFISSPNSTESRDLGLTETDVLAVSAAGQMAVLRRFGVSPNHFTHRGTLAQVSIGADAPRERGSLSPPMFCRAIP